MFCCGGGVGCATGAEAAVGVDGVDTVVFLASSVLGLMCTRM
jgi:hypothetical protein